MKDFLYPLRRMHGYLNDAKLQYKKKKELKHRFKDKPYTVFLLLTPEHDNLGDHGIAWAEEMFLNENEIQFIEITGRKLCELQKNGMLNLFNGFPILINGGGFLGTLWKESEDLLRNIMQANPKSSIMCLPNTIYYEDSIIGKEEFEKSKKIYNTHKKLYLYARENKSYSIMQRAYKNVKLVPDMVFSLNQCKQNTKRNGCLLCLRSDREKTRTDNQDETIRQQVTELFGDDITITDMIAPYQITPDQREQELEKKFDQFRKAELVITDRLHGMIFAAITGTPCIVIDSKSPKVRGCYEWIKDLDYIRFAENVSRITEEYHKISKCEHTYNNEHLQHYYQELADDIIHKVIRR